MTQEAPLYAGLSGLELDTESLDFGDGVQLCKTYAHVMSYVTLAFKEPASRDSHHPGPWVATSNGEGFDVRAELLIPTTYQHPTLSSFEVARTIVALLRIFVDPEIRFTFASSEPMSSLREKPYSGVPVEIGGAIEIHRRHFALVLVDGSKKLEHIAWVQKNWRAAANLRGQSAEFRLALEVFEVGQFIPSTAMILVSIWGALEAIFSPSSTELRFRVSALIAAYMKPPGEARLAEQQKIAKLYDKRSAAAHGKPRHDQEDVLVSFELLRMVLIKLIERKKLPSKEDLDRLLFTARWP
jgi:hypothetical protein